MLDFGSGLGSGLWAG